MWQQGGYVRSEPIYIAEKGQEQREDTFSELKNLLLVRTNQYKYLSVNIYLIVQKSIIKFKLILIELKSVPIKWVNSERYISKANTDSSFNIIGNKILILWGNYHVKLSCIR